MISRMISRKFESFLAIARFQDLKPLPGKIIAKELQDIRFIIHQQNGRIFVFHQEDKLGHTKLVKTQFICLLKVINWISL